MRFLFVHGWKGFSLAEWYLRDALSRACSVPVEFMSYDMPTDGVPINDTLPRLVSTFKPDVVGFSCHYWSIGEFLEAAKWVKHLRPESAVVLGGPHVNSPAIAAQILTGHRSVDFVFRGAVRQGICRFVEMRATGGDESTVSGMSFRRGGMPRHNPIVPTSSRSGEPIFCTDNVELTEHLSSAIEASYETVIGCRAKCAYCVYPTGQFDVIDDDLVEAELAYLCSFEVPFIRICDAHFAGSKKRAKRFLQHLAKVNKGSSIKIYPDTKHVDAEYVRLIRDAGAEITSIGVQTTHAESLEAIRRHSARDEADAIRLLLENFPNTPADCIVGLPHDTPDTVEQTFRDVLDLGFARVNPFRLHLFPGTSLGDTPSEYLDEGSVVQTHTGQLLSSDSFPVESLERVANLVHAVQVVSPLVHAREWLRDRGRDCALMDVAGKLDSVSLLAIYQRMTAASPVPLVRSFDATVDALSACLGPEPTLRERVARDLLEFLRSTSAERRQRDLVWGREGRRVEVVVLSMPSFGVGVWDLARAHVSYAPSAAAARARRPADTRDDSRVLELLRSGASEGPPLAVTDRDVRLLERSSC